MNEITKGLQILFVLSPVIIPIIILGLVLKRGFNKLQRYSFFWLIASVVIGISLTWRIINNRSGLDILTSAHIFTLCIATYEGLKAKEKKMKHPQK